MNEIRQYILETYEELLIDYLLEKVNKKRGKKTSKKKKTKFKKKLKKVAKIFGIVAFNVLLFGLKTGLFSDFINAYAGFERQEKSKYKEYRSSYESDWWKSWGGFGRTEQEREKKSKEKAKERGYSDKEYEDIRDKWKKAKEKAYEQESEERRKDFHDKFKKESKYAKMSADERRQHERLDKLLKLWAQRNKGMSEGEINNYRSIINRLAKEIGRESEMVDDFIAMYNLMEEFYT